MKTFKQFSHEQRGRLLDIPPIHMAHTIVPTVHSLHGMNRDKYEEYCKTLPVNEGSIEDWFSKTGTVVHSFDRDLLKEHKANYTPEDVQNIAKYTFGGLHHDDHSGSRRLTEHLLNAHKLKHPHPREFTIHGDPKIHYDLDSMDKTMKRNTLKKPLVTYSGIGFNPQLKKGDVFYTPAYMSSSLNRQVATNYANLNHTGGEHRHIFVIHHEPGHQGAYIANDPDLTPFDHDEFITPRSRNFKLMDNPIQHESHDGKKYKLWNVKPLYPKY